MRNSIGSLAALAAFAAPVLAAPYLPQAADFHHVPISLNDGPSIDFDIDGDNTPDFYVYGNSGSSLFVELYSPTLRSGALTFGDYFESADATLDFANLIPEDQIRYLGFSFTSGTTGLTHAAWVLFDTNVAAPMVIGGGWQTVPGVGITVGTPAPVPEPSSYAALAGAAMLTTALVRRRRTPAPAAPRPTA